MDEVKKQTGLEKLLYDLANDKWSRRGFGTAAAGATLYVADKMTGSHVAKAVLNLLSEGASDGENPVYTGKNTSSQAGDDEEIVNKYVEKTLSGNYKNIGKTEVAGARVDRNIKPTERMIIDEGMIYPGEETPYISLAVRKDAKTGNPIGTILANKAAFNGDGAIHLGNMGKGNRKNIRMDEFQETRPGAYVHDIDLKELLNERGLTKARITVESADPTTNEWRNYLNAVSAFIVD